METTARNTATAAAAGAFVAGVAVALQSARHDHVAGSIIGSCLVLVALVVVVLVLVHRWVADVATERAALSVAQRQAVDERTRYIAAQAALENEQTRLNRDIAAERASNDARLKAERAKLRDEFEEERAQLAADAFQTGAEMERAGMLRPDRERHRGNLIAFPRAAAGVEPGRSREHEAVNP